MAELKGQTERSTEQEGQGRGEYIWSNQLEKHVAQRIGTGGWGGISPDITAEVLAFSEGGLLLWAALAHKSWVNIDPFDGYLLSI